MSDTLELGAHVQHAVRGLGKIVHLDSAEAHVYFRDMEEAVPDKRVKRFKIDAWHLLQRVEAEPDSVLDGLPPWNGEKFVRPTTSLTIANAKRDFLRMFPGGIDNAAFQAHEVGAKRAAHQRFQKAFLPQAQSWIAAGDGTAIAEALEHVWGKRAPKDDRLVLLHHRAEGPAYFDALKAGGSATVDYARCALAVIESGSDAAFDAYIKSMAALPTREGGVEIDKWPSATWLPFIAAPKRFMMVRTSIIKSFASAYPRELNIGKGPNTLGHRCILEFVEDFRRALQASEVNIAGREIDFIDVQSFMWSVAKYTDEGVEEAARTLRSKVRRATSAP